MDIAIFKTITAGLTIAIGAAAPAIAVGLIGAAAMKAIGRNPEATPQIRNQMILAIAFAEAIAIYVLIITLIVKFV
jgi:F-type H+-transporting ATPase subunit c